MATQEDLLKLSMLPLERFSDATLTVSSARDKWTETGRIIDAIRSSGLTLGAQLQQSLDNLRTWVSQALGAISTFQTRGGSLTETVLQVEGLEQARAGFLKELPTAQQLFNQLKSETGLDAQTQFVKSVQSLTQPPSESKLVALGLGLGALWLVKIAFFD